MRAFAHVLKTDQRRRVRVRMRAVAHVRKTGKEQHTCGLARDVHVFCECL